MRILLTGAFGFVGARVLESFLKAGYSVIVLKRKKSTLDPQSPPQPETNCEVSSKNLLIVYFDNLSEIDQLIFDLDCIVHIAASANSTLLDWQVLYSANVELTRKVVRLGIRCGASKFIYTSSLSVYGAPSGVVSQSTPVNPNERYGFSKYLGEIEVEAFSACGSCYIVRLPAVIGRGAKNHWLARMISSIKSGQSWELINPNALFNSILSLGDFNRLLQVLIQMNDDKSIQIFPIGTSVPIKVSAIAEIFGEIFSENFEIFYSKYSQHSFYIENNFVEEYLNFATSSTQSSLENYIFDAFFKDSEVE